MMKAMVYLGITLLAGVPLFTSALYAQPANRSQGQGGQSGSTQRMYDVKTVVTLSGSVVSVDTIPSSGGRQGGVHLVLKTEKEELSVHLGPAWYLAEQKLSLGKGDEITVTGSRVTYDKAPALIARTVKKGEKVWELRRSDGTPLWSGPRR